MIDKLDDSRYVLGISKAYLGRILDMFLGAEHLSSTPKGTHGECHLGISECVILTRIQAQLAWITG